MIYPILLILGDFMAILTAFTVAYIFRVQIDDRALAEQIPAIDFITAFLLLIPFWLIINAFLGLYGKRIYEKRLSEMARLLVGSFIGILLIIGYDFILDDTIFPARLVPIYGLVISFLLLVLVRNLLWVFRKAMFKYGYGVRRVLIVGNAPATARLCTVLSDTPTSGYNIVALITRKDNVPFEYKNKVFTGLDGGLAAIEEMRIDTVIQTEMFEDDRKNQKILQAARGNHLSYRFIPAKSELFAAKNTVEIMHGFPVVSVHQTPLIGWGRVAKRVFDILATLAVGVVAVPIVLFMAILIKLRDPSGPILFKHKRITRFGTTFEVYKLRSMYWKYCAGPAANKKTEVEIFTEMGRTDLVKEFQETRKVKDDPRIMTIGKFIRATSIDELPQLINVLKGDLSLVGPRPMVKDELALYKKHGGGNIVQNVKSGITGLWQVSGRSDLSFEERVKLDVYYVQNWSFWLDIRILLRTVIVVISKSGAR